MRVLINLFIRRPLVGNIITFGVIFCAFLFWQKIGKEQMPDITFNWVRVSVPYPGASAEDVELFITKPIEEKLKGVTGLDEVSSVSASGNSSFSIFLQPDTLNIAEKVQEIKDAVDAVEFPRDAEQPVYRQFKTSERAFIDVGIYLKDVELLGVEDRIRLQEVALSFKNRLLSLPEVSGVETQGYLRPEIQIKIDPKKLQRYEISLQHVRDQITQQNVRSPIGAMSDRQETEITVVSELDSIEPLKNVIISSGFEGQKVHLKDVATIERGFQKNNSILKVQGREGVIFAVQKSTSVDILTAQKALTRFMHDFHKYNPESPADFILMDDESYEVRNRLSLIGTNGIMGFILIVVILFLFLDLKAGLWVAVGIPFSLAFTMILAMLLGLTINNMTLAAVIIVLGIVVDDAIIVAENITRRNNGHMTMEEVAVDRTLNVFNPVLASILTTCAAFIPLYFFTGRFGLFVAPIPTIVFLMLLGSLLESTLILPGHMVHPLPGENFLKRTFRNGGEIRQRIVSASEDFYRRSLLKILPYRGIILLTFIGLLIFSGLLFQNKLKYVMFPREEATSLSLRVVGPKDAIRKEMALMVREVEDIFLKDETGLVVNVRSSIGMSRRGGEVRENEASLRIELVPPSERKVKLDDAIKSWEKEAAKLTKFSSIKFLKDRFGSDSGSPIVIEIQENNDRLRTQVAQSLVEALQKMPDLTSIDVETPVTRPEYRLHVKDDEVSRMNLNFDQLSSILRTYVQGSILYRLNSGEEEVDVRLMGGDENKRSIQSILDMSVANNKNYLVPVRNLVEMEEGRRPSNI